MKNYHEKYRVDGEGLLVKTTILIQKAQYHQLKEIKKIDGIPVNFFVQKAIDKAILEWEREKKLLKKESKGKKSAL